MKEHWADGIINQMRNEGSYNNTPVMGIGIVKSINPLQIDYADLPLTKDNLYINSMLLEYERQFTIPTQSTSGTTSGTDPDGSVTSVGFSNKKIIQHIKLKVGSRVVLQPIEAEQKYIVLCEVV